MSSDVDRKAITRAMGSYCICPSVLCRGRWEIVRGQPATQLAFAAYRPALRHRRGVV